MLGDEVDRLRQVGGRKSGAEREVDEEAVGVNPEHGRNESRRAYR